MPKRQESKQQAYQAVKKYRRLRTIVKKVQELADLRDLKISLLIYNPRQHKIEEIYTDKCVKFAQVK